MTGFTVFYSQRTRRGSMYRALIRMGALRRRQEFPWRSRGAGGGRRPLTGEQAAQAAARAPVLIDLGWLPVPGNRRMPAVASIQGGQHVMGLLSPPPPAGFVRAVVMPQVNGTLLTTSLDIALLRRSLHLPTLAPRVLKLDPVLPIGYARDLDILPNTLPPERHLGYAVQWFGLALTVLATALLLTFRKPGAHRTP